MYAHLLHSIAPRSCPCDGRPPALRRHRRRGHPLAPLTRFRFGRDPLFWTGCVAYALNRWAWSPPPGFFQAHFADLWLVPCALPPVLWLHDQLGWRRAGPPRAGEVAAHLAGWSLLFEWAGPYLRAGAVGDPWDVVSYTAGALVAWVWWRRD